MTNIDKIPTDPAWDYNSIWETLGATPKHINRISYFAE